MKKGILCAITALVMQFVFAQTKCNLSKVVPWIVLDGQMVSNVHPPKQGVSSYILSVKTTAIIDVVQSEEIDNITKTETINGLQRWMITYKSKKARTMSTVIIKCGCEVFVKKLEQPITLSNN